MKKNYEAPTAELVLLAPAEDIAATDWNWSKNTGTLKNPSSGVDGKFYWYEDGTIS